MIAELEPLWKAQRDLDNYWRQVYTSSMWTLGNTALKTNLEGLKPRIDELAENGRLGVAVQRGFTEENGQRYPFTAQNWKNVHHAIWDGVSGQAEILKQSPSVWTDFIVPTWHDIGTEIDKGKEVINTVGEKLDFLTSPIGMLLLLFILVAAVAWKVA